MLIRTLFKKNIGESISVHLRSDVPYCLFFSGGIDSMLIMYFMNQISLKKKSAYKVNIENKKTDNSILKKISNKFNIEFNEISFTEKDFGNYFLLLLNKSMNQLQIMLFFQLLNLLKRHQKILK